MLVLVTKFLAVTALLLGSPAGHLPTTDGNEEQNAPAQATDKVDANPGEDLEQIVGAGHQTESETRWDTPFSGTCTTQVAQHQVGVQVGQLRKGKECNPPVKKLRVHFVDCCLRIRAEDPVCNVEACQDPVVCAVLENVAGRHGGIAEAVDEDRFKFTFQEVDGQKSANQELDIGRLGERLVEVVVNEWPKRKEEERGDQEGTKVFNDEHSSPSNLGA